MQAISRAATLLNISELKLLNEAYLTRFGDHADEDDLMFLLTHFTMFGEVPDWVDTYARGVLADLAANRLVIPNSFCVPGLAPRVGDRSKLGFSLQH